SMRTVSLLALAGIALLLWRLGPSSEGPDPLPALAFLSMGIVVQYGRTGEIDVLFAFFVTAALACFELGRRRRSPGLQWVLSQSMVAAGVLTKGIAPLFFYPPVAFCALRRRDAFPFSARAFALGLLVMAALVAAWVVPYSLRSPAAALGERLASEVAERTVGFAPGRIAWHLLSYPAVVLGSAAPWSLGLLALAAAAGRSRLAASRLDPALVFAGSVVAWGALVFLFVPGTVPRYLIPVLPFLAVLLAALLRESRGVSRGLLAAGLAYGLVYACVVDARVAARNREQYVGPGEAIAEAVTDGRPLVCLEGVDRKLSYVIAHRLNRAIRERPPEGPFFWVAGREAQPPPGAVKVTEAGRFGLWRIDAR
ncbi:MAG TPA: hypothetical protein VLI67_04115, partial [Vicinamibacteria bacterium]|nr:hypothetical protein [Vicinamibacteria bacterium]